MGAPAAHAEDAILNLFATLDSDSPDEHVRVTTQNVSGGFGNLFEAFLERSRGGFWVFLEVFDVMFFG